MKKQIKSELGENWYDYKLSKNGEECNLTLGQLYKQWGITYEEMSFVEDINDALYEEGYDLIGNPIIVYKGGI